MTRSVILFAASLISVAANPLLRSPALSLPAGSSPPTPLVSFPPVEVSYAPIADVPSSTTAPSPSLPTPAVPISSPTPYPDIWDGPASVGLLSYSIDSDHAPPLTIPVIGPKQQSSPSFVVAPSITGAIVPASPNVVQTASPSPPAQALPPGFNPTPAFSPLSKTSPTISSPAVSLTAPTPLALPSGIQIVTEGTAPILLIPMAYTLAGLPQVSTSTFTVPSAVSIPPLEISSLEQGTSSSKEPAPTATGFSNLSNAIPPAGLPYYPKSNKTAAAPSGGTAVHSFPHPSPLVSGAVTPSLPTALLNPIPTPVPIDIPGLLENITAAYGILSFLSSTIDSDLNDIAVDSLLVSSLVEFVIGLFDEEVFGTRDGSGEGDAGAEISSADVRMAAQVVGVMVGVLKSGEGEALVRFLGAVVLGLLGG